MSPLFRPYQTQPRRMHKRILTGIGVCAVLSLFLACAQSFPGLETPVDRPNYPTGLALHPSGEHLAVVSSNSDLGYARGALLMADLSELDAFLASTTQNPTSMSEVPVLNEPYANGIYIPSFGGAPIFSANGANLFVTTREENQLHQIDVDPLNAVRLGCGDTNDSSTSVTDCGGSSERNLAIPGNDPISMELLRDDEQIVEGLVASLLSTDLVLFRYDQESAQLRTKEVFPLNALFIDDLREATGIRALEVVPGNAERDAVVFALVEHSALSNGDRSVDLWWFSLDTLPPNQVQKISLTDLSGARGATDLAWVPSQNALLVLLREPDAIARFEFSAPLPEGQPQLRVFRETCQDPVALRIAELPQANGTSSAMAYVTCYGEHAVVSIDPLTLRTASALRFAGYGPFDLVVQSDHEPPRAFVSFFLDDSIGVLDLVREGVPGLYPRARLGNARPQPERGTR